MLAGFMVLLLMAVSSRRGLKMKVPANVDEAGPIQQHLVYCGIEDPTRKRMASLPLDSQDFKLTSDWIRNSPVSLNSSNKAAR